MSSLLSDFFASSSQGEQGPRNTQGEKCSREGDCQNEGAFFTPIHRPLPFEAFDWSDIPLYGDSSAPSLPSSQSSQIMDEQQGQQSEKPPLSTKSARMEAQVSFSAPKNYPKTQEPTDSDLPCQRMNKVQRRLPTSPVSSMDCGLWDVIPRGVLFAPAVVVHSFTVVVGDHPACELPMQLGDCQSTSLVPLPPDYVSIFRPVRPIPLSYEERLDVLQASTGCSEDELRLQEYQILRHE